MKQKIRKMECQRCGYSWVPRVVDVRKCPKCFSPYWDRPRQPRGPRANPVLTVTDSETSPA